MLPVYLVTSLPGYLLAQAEQSVHELSVAVADSLKPSLLAIKVNHSLPPGVDDDDAPAATKPVGPVVLNFSSPTPKDNEFFRARLFAEPLVPTDNKTAPGENEALAKALLAYVQTPIKGSGDAAQRVAPIKQFLVNHPTSRWGLSLWLNLGSLYRKAGYWTRALDAWEQAWTAGKKATSPNARALADRAVAELAELNARLGRYERLKPLFDELDGSGRDLRGAAADKLAGARQGLWMMDNQPELAFRCGPMALNCLRLADNPLAPLEPKIFDAHSTRQGISLTQVAALSRDIGRPMQMAFRTADMNGKAADFLTPSVVHWKAGHYAALVEGKNGRYRVDDPTFGDTSWVSRAALEAETDGYYLVSADKSLPAGWRTVAELEGNKVWGKGNTGSKDPNATKCNDARAKACAECQGGMANYNVEAMLTSLAIGDVPLSYTPPRGQPIGFGVRYSQHEASQPAVFNYWNMGQKWTTEWSGYIEDNGTAGWLLQGYDSSANPIYTASGGIYTGPFPALHLPGGGLENYQIATQSNRFSPPDDHTNAPSFVPFNETYDSTDQTVSFVQKTTDDPGNGQMPPGQVYTYSALVRPRLVQKGPQTYERDLPDGTVEVYNHSDGASTYPRRIFLTKRTDPSGNSLSFRYDGNQRLLAVTDALGQVTTLSYELTSDPLKVTKVTDPFGRSCQFSYNDNNQLESIIDTAGIQSSFTYADNDFIDSLTTPYGTTTFAFADVTTDPTMGVAAWLEATDQYGDTERAEFRHGAPGIPFSESVAPQTIPVFNQYISSRNTFYWDKKAYKEAKQSDGTFDYTRAKIMHFLHAVDTNVCSGILESTKNPLENRVWLFYQGQNSPAFLTTGMSTHPSMVARVLDDGSTQLSQYQYNDQQRVTKATDPLGRETSYDYDPTNSLDLLDVRCTTGGLNEQLFSATYNAAHQPLITTDAASQTTILTYNAKGQLQTSTDPLGRAVTFHYDGQGYLQEIDGFDPSIKSTFTYDGFGRLASTTTYPDAYTVQVGYESVGGNPLATLNRPTTATYPDGSYSEVDYTNLDAAWTRDRGGNWTHLLTNKLRQLEASIDPLGQITQFGYCKCGEMVKIIDPNGNVTQWKLDAEERPTTKIYADNTEVDYAYENTTSRLKTITDAKGQHTNYTYYLDGTVQNVSYTNAEHATPGVTYTYDPQRGRLATMVDQIGTTTYNYNPLGSGGAGALGAGQVQSVSGPFANEVVAYQYDQIGRVKTRTVNGVDETYGFDDLGRLQTDANALGTFTYGYDGTTGRLSSVSYPNGQQALYGYQEDNTQDRRLSQIKHLSPGGGTLDQFDYSYDGPLGRIAHWNQQQPGTAGTGTLATTAYDLSYDAVGQLKRARLNDDGSNPGSGVWSYDAAGNRTGVQAGSGTLSTAVPTPTNALFSLSGGGKVRVAGSLNEWASVSVNGQSASLDASTNRFEAFVPLPVGTQTLTINATDASNNTATSRYQLTITAGVGESFGYDANGNTTALTAVASGAIPQSLEWDALDRVIAINQGTHRTEFGYDGGGARVKITEKEAGSVTSDHLYVGNEERDAASGQVLRKFYGQGEQRTDGGTANNYFYADDHLGSLRELTDGAGTVRASYGYDVWGARTKQKGNLDTETGFTGYWHHAPSGLEVSPTRLYNASLGRFLNQDPLQEGGGQLNLFAYCTNDPVNLSDPSGMSFAGIAIGIGVGVVAGIGLTMAAAFLAPEFAAGLLCAMMVGAFSGLAGDIARQLYDKSCVNWNEALAAAAAGALFAGALHYAAPFISRGLGAAWNAIRGGSADLGAALAPAADATANASAPVGRIGGTIDLGDGTVGSIGGEMIVEPGTNLPTTIAGRSYSGHSLDQMQGRGFVPSAVENTIQQGTTYSTRPGTIGYYDSVNDMRVIVNSQTGKVVTVIPGKP